MRSPWDGGPPTARSAHDLAMACDGGNGDSNASAAVAAKEEGYNDLEGNVHWAFVYVQNEEVERNMRLFGSPEGPGNVQFPKYRIHHYNAPLVTPKVARPASSAQSSLGVDADLDGNLDRLIDERGLSAPSQRSSLHVRSVSSAPVARRRCPVVLGSGARSSGEGAPALPFNVDAKPNSVSILSRPNGERVELGMLNYRWVSPEPVSREWSAWYAPSAHQPHARSPSIDVTPPNGARSDVSTEGRSWSSRDIGYDDVLYHHFRFPSSGRGPLPINTPLFNKFVGRIGARGLWDSNLPRLNLGTPVRRYRIRLRNIKVGAFVVARRLHVGTVARGGQTFIHNLEGRMINAVGPAFMIDNAQGRNYRARECKLNPPLRSHVRIVYIDTRKLKWCSVDSVAFHSFAWPRSTQEARGIARTLFTNHCNWADVLIVRGRCFGSNHCCHWANRILENLLWNWACVGRPYVVYNEGGEVSGGGGVVPKWLEGNCTYPDFCQCKLVGGWSWHHPGSLYSNIVGRQHKFFGGNCGG